MLSLLIDDNTGHWAVSAIILELLTILHSVISLYLFTGHCSLPLLCNLQIRMENIIIWKKNKIIKSSQTERYHWKSVRQQSVGYNKRSLEKWICELPVLCPLSFWNLICAVCACSSKSWLKILGLHSLARNMRQRNPTESQAFQTGFQQSSFPGWIGSLWTCVRSDRRWAKQCSAIQYQCCH